MKNNTQKSYLAFLMSVTFAVLALGLLFTFEIAQAESYEYVRSYNSGDGRSQIQVHTRSSSDSNTHISNRVHAYSSSASNSVHTSYGQIIPSTSLKGSQEVSPAPTVTIEQTTFEVVDNDEVAPSRLIQQIQELLDMIRNITGKR